MQEKRAQADAAKAAESTAPVQPVVTEPERPRFDGEVLGTMQNTRTGKRRASVRVDEDILIVAEGDKLPGGFTVSAITETEVRFKENKTGREVTIKLETR